jgi:hypothetical protein
MEKALALVETILAFWLAYPASIAFGKVLLQTAPPQDAIQTLALKKAIREVEAHPSVTRVSRPHIWQLTPHSPSHKSAQVTPTRPKPISRATSHYNRRERSEKSGDWSNSGAFSILVANIVVHLRADVESRKVIEVTRMAYEAFDNAMGSRRSGHKWAMRGGELSVMVMRGERKQVKIAHDHHHHHHDHVHGHGHEYGSDHHHHHIDDHVCNSEDALQHKTNGHSHDSHRESSSAHTHHAIHPRNCEHGHEHQH